MTSREILALVVERLSYDPSTGIFRWKTNGGSRARAGEQAGSVNKDGYRVIRLGKRDFYAHRLAWLTVHGEMPALIDHIDAARDNNSITNLRIASKSSNGANRGAQANNTSGFKGVKKRYHRWIAQMHVNGRNKYLGSFSSKEEAAKAYRMAAEQEYGEFARSC